MTDEELEVDDALSLALGLLHHPPILHDGVSPVVVFPVRAGTFQLELRGVQRLQPEEVVQRLS